MEKVTRVAERQFEMDLDRWFGEYPQLPDAGLFASRVASRLDRGWSFRQFVIGGLGMAGGLIGGAQILGSGMMGRLGVIGARSGEMANAVAEHIATSPLAEGVVGRGLSNLLAAGVSTDGEILGMSAVLATLALGLFVTRAIREL